MKQGTTTKILFIYEDEASFQIWKCMANVIEQLPPVELFLALDATEGLNMIDHVKPDVIVLDNDMADERDMFLDNISVDHPPILIQTDSTSRNQQMVNGKQVVYVEKNGTLEGIHKTLLVATTVAKQQLPKDVAQEQIH